MWKCVFHRWHCIELQYNGCSFFINPSYQNEKTVRAIEKAECVYIFLTTDQACDDRHNAVIHHLSTHTPFHMDGFGVRYVEHGSNSFVVIKLDGQTIIYDNGLSDNEIFEDIIEHSPLTLYIPDLTKRNADYHLSLLTALWWAKHVVPLSSVDQDRAIDFAREVMMHWLGVPKYLTSWQYLVLSVW